MIFWLIIAVIIFLLLEGFFSGSEIAIVSTDRAFLHQQIREGSKKAVLMHSLLEKPEIILGTTLLGTNISLVCSNFAANELFAKLFNPGISWISLFFMVPLTLFFGEILPKAYFRKYSDILAYKVIKPINIIARILFPAVFGLRLVSGWIRRVIIGGDVRKMPRITRDEFRILLESQRISSKENLIHRMLNNLSGYMEKDVRDIAIPMVNVVHCDPADGYLDIADIFIRSKYSRIPVYDKDKDEIIGIINDLDLLEKKNRSRKAAKIAVKTICIPENLALGRALIMMRKQFCELAAVIDEYGGTAGIVTLKDVIAEITGKLSDRYETDDQGYFHRVSRNAYIVDALFRLDELQAKTGVEFEELPYETVNGLLNHLLGRIPRKDDICRFEKVSFKVLRAKPQKAEMVRITIDK